MQIDVLLKIAGIGLLVTVICQILTRSGREEMATLAAVAGILLTVLMVLSLAEDVFTRVQAIFHLT